MSQPLLAFGEVFDADDPYFYGPHLHEVAAGDTEEMYRLLVLVPRMRTLTRLPLPPYR